MLMNDNWRQSARCAPAGPGPFFDEPWADDQLQVDVLERTRDAYCGLCPVRRACLADIMEHEKGQIAADRFALVAYLSPGQRESIEKRGIATCPRCGAVRDPLLLAEGRLECPVKCGQRSVMVTPPPHEGDQWTKRHTTLSKRIVAWVFDTTLPGDVVVSPTQMSEMMGGVRRSDVLRVYRELVTDGTLVELDKQYHRGAMLASRNWSPKWTDHTPIRVQED